MLGGRDGRLLLIALRGRTRARATHDHVDLRDGHRRTHASRHAPAIKGRPLISSLSRRLEPYPITVHWGAATPPFTSRAYRGFQTLVPARIPAPEPIVIAHRGAHGPDRAQNSLSAIERALEIGAPGVEIDVCSLRDGELVVAHDDWILSGSRKLPLAELLLTDLRRLSTGQVLRIEAALDLFSDADTMVCLDWKGAGDVTLVGRLVQRYGLTGRTIVSSTEPAAVAGLKDRYPRLAAGLSLNGCATHLHRSSGAADGIVAAVAACGADAAMLQHGLAVQDVLAALRALGVTIFLWTAKDSQTFESLWKRSPDGIMSDLVEEHHRLPGARTER